MAITIIQQEPLGEMPTLDDNKLSSPALPHGEAEDNNQHVNATEQPPESGVCSLEEMGAAPSDAQLTVPSVSTRQAPVFGVCLPTKSGIDDTTVKLPASLIVQIDSIDYDPTLPVDKQLTEQIKTSINTPWGGLLLPLVVSKISNPKNGKEWLLRDGLQRLMAAEQIGLTKVRVVVVDGTEEEIRLLTQELDLARRQPTAYRTMRQLSAWYELLQQVHPVYKSGGNKKKNAADRKVQGLPTLAELIEKTTGLRKSSFYGKVQAFQNLEPTQIRKYLDTNPHSATAKKELWVRDLSKFSHEDQKKLAPFLQKLASPKDAYFQSMREEAASKSDQLPDDERFPIYHEPFWENAKRIADGTVGLIATDPNWHLAEDCEEGEMWTLHGLPVAPQMTADTWHTFGELAAQKLSLDGYAAVLVGQQNVYEIESILRKYLSKRWEMCYLHASGAGTIARKAGFASHWRPVLVFQRKDATKKEDLYKHHAHDVVPGLPKLATFDNGLLELLRLERTQIDGRIAELEAEEPDPFVDDLIVTMVRRTEQLKLWHPWAQHVPAFREIVRRLSEPGDFVWEPFVGSGTTAIAAVSCTDRQLKDGKLVEVEAPRRGMGCDIMEIWAKVAKFRVWESQLPTACDALHKDEFGRGDTEPDNDQEENSNLDVDKAS